MRIALNEGNHRLRGIHDERSIARIFPPPPVAVLVDPERPGVGIVRALLVVHGRYGEESPAAGGLIRNRRIKDDQVELAFIHGRGVRRGKQSKLV